MIRRISRTSPSSSATATSLAPEHAHHEGQRRRGASASRLLRERGDRAGLEDEGRAVPRDRPLDVLVGAEVALDPAAHVDERGQRVVVEARLCGAPPAPRRGRRRGRRRRAHTRRPSRGRARARPRRDLADEVIVGGDLAADDGEAEAPARVDRDHARVAAHRVAGEEDAGDGGVDHELHGDPHRRVVLAEAGAIADRGSAVETHPAVAHGVAHVLGAAHPEVGLLLAGEGRFLAVLAERARADGDRRLTELVVAARDLVA